jgi:hypothetical protein
MNINDLMNKKDFKLLNTKPLEDREIAYVRCCDLLSWVMAKGHSGDAWITVQTHVNIIAVASLLEFSCIILPESIEPDPDTLAKAEENDIPVFTTPLDAYAIFKNIRL